MTHRSPVRRMSLDGARAWLDGQAFAPTDRMAPTDIGLVGRVLARDVFAKTDLPAGDMAVVDGFAVRVDDVLGANDYNLIRLALWEDSSELTVGRAAPVVSGRPFPTVSTPSCLSTAWSGWPVRSRSLPQSRAAMVSCEKAGCPDRNATSRRWRSPVSGRCHAAQRSRLQRGLCSKKAQGGSARLWRQGRQGHDVIDACPPDRA